MLYRLRCAGKIGGFHMTSPTLPFPLPFLPFSFESSLHSVRQTRSALNFMLQNRIIVPRNVVNCIEYTRHSVN